MTVQQEQQEQEQEQHHEQDHPATDSSTATADPVRSWTVRLMALGLLLLVYYLIADRITPYSSQAKVHALVVPVAAEVSGTVVEVRVTGNQSVSAGDVLFVVDKRQYELGVAAAEADLELARQSTGASAATVTAAEAGVVAAQAGLERSRQDVMRLRRIKSQDPGALSERKIEAAEAGLIIAQQEVAAARADLEKARQALGQTGDKNSQIQQAQAALDQALVDLDNTVVTAPTDGVVTDVRVDAGNFAGTGQPQMTFISTEVIWVQADFTENNLGHVEAGSVAGLSFDIYPGRTFSGTVAELGFGVAVDNTPLGSLPTINNDRQWLRSAQRFPVLVDFEMSAEDMARLRVGSQASVQIYATEFWPFNILGKVFLRVGSVLSYAY